MGDVVHNMPVIADIRRRHPEAQIDWLVEESFVGLVELVSGVRRAIPVSLRRWRKRILSADNWREIGAFRRALAAEHYDLVIDCQGLIKTAWVASMARGPLVGLGNRTDGAGFEWPVRFFYGKRVPIDSFYWPMAVLVLAAAVVRLIAMFRHDRRKVALGAP